MDCKTGFTQEYSFGSIGFKVEASGIDKANDLCNYLVAGGTTLSETEAIRKLISAKPGESTKQTCTNDFKFGDVSTHIEIDFDLNVEVSNRNLNDIVAEFMLLYWSAAGKVLGNHRGLGQMNAKSLTADIDKVLELVSPQSANGKAAASQRNGGQKALSQRPARQRSASRR